jgi:hypothetical protein
MLDLMLASCLLFSTVRMRVFRGSMITSLFLFAISFFDYFPNLDGQQIKFCPQ